MKKGRLTGRIRRSRGQGFPIAKGPVRILQGIARLRMGHWVAMSMGLSVLLTLGLAWSGYVYFRQEFPDVSVLRDVYPVVVYHGPDRDREVTLSAARPGSWVGLSQISRYAVGAVLVSEDWAFYQHDGFDPQQMREALIEDLQAGSFVRGASTITQQVVKNVFLTSDKNLWRKLKELVLAIRIEKSVGKRKILETYLNVAEWGEGIFGIRAASRHYFGKHPSQLSPREAAFLAMLLPSPKRYGVSHRRGELTRFARLSINRVLARMAQGGYISASQRDAERYRRLPFEKSLSAEGLAEGEAEVGTDSDVGTETEEDDSAVAGAVPSTGAEARVGQGAEPEESPSQAPDAGTVPAAPEGGPGSDTGE